MDTGQTLREGRGHKDTEAGYHVMVMAEIRVMKLQTKEHQRLPATNLGKVQRRILL